MTFFNWNTKTARYNLYVPRFQFVLAAQWLRSKDIRFTSRIDYRSDTAIFTIKRNDIAERWINALLSKHGKKPVTQYTNTTRCISREEWQRRWQFASNLNKAVIRETTRDNSPGTHGFSSISEIAASTPFGIAVSEHFDPSTSSGHRKLSVPPVEPQDRQLNIHARLNLPKPQVQAMATHNDGSIERDFTDSVSGSDVGASDTKASQQAITNQFPKPKSVHKMTWDELHSTCLKHGIDPNSLKGSKPQVVKVQMKAALRSIGITKA